MISKINKLQKLHNQFEDIAKQIEKTEDKINDCIENDLDTSKWDYKLEKLQDREYDIQCKIEKIKS